MAFSREEFVSMVKDPTSLGDFHSDHGLPPKGDAGDQMGYTCHTAVQHWGYLSLYDGDMTKTKKRIREVTMWDCNKCGQSINHMSNAQTYVKELLIGAEPLLVKEMLYCLRPGDIIITGDLSKGTVGITHSMVFVGIKKVEKREEARVIGFNNTSTFSKQIYDRYFKSCTGKLQRAITSDKNIVNIIDKKLPPKLAPDQNEYDMLDETYWSVSDKDGNFYDYEFFGSTHEKAPAYFLRYEKFMENNEEHAKYSYR